MNPPSLSPMLGDVYMTIFFLTRPKDLMCGISGVTTDLVGPEGTFGPRKYI